MRVYHGRVPRSEADTVIQLHRKSVTQENSEMPRHVPKFQSNHQINLSLQHKFHAAQGSMSTCTIEQRNSPNVEASKPTIDHPPKTSRLTTSDSGDSVTNPLGDNVPTTRPQPKASQTSPHRPRSRHFNIPSSLVSREFMEYKLNTLSRAMTAQQSRERNPINVSTQSRRAQTCTSFRQRYALSTRARARINSATHNVYAKSRHQQTTNTVTERGRNRRGSIVLQTAKALRDMGHSLTAPKLGKSRFGRSAQTIHSKTTQVSFLGNVVATMSKVHAAREEKRKQIRGLTALRDSMRYEQEPGRAHNKPTIMSDDGISSSGVEVLGNAQAAGGAVGAQARDMIRRTRVLAVRRGDAIAAQAVAAGLEQFHKTAEHQLRDIQEAKEAGITVSPLRRQKNVENFSTATTDMCTQSNQTTEPLSTRRRRSIINLMQVTGAQQADYPKYTSRKPGQFVSANFTWLLPSTERYFACTDYDASTHNTEYLGEENESIGNQSLEEESTTSRSSCDRIEQPQRPGQHACRSYADVTSKDELVRLLRRRPSLCGEDKAAGDANVLMQLWDLMGKQEEANEAHSKQRINIIRAKKATKKLWFDSKSSIDKREAQNQILHMHEMATPTPKTRQDVVQSNLSLDNSAQSQRAARRHRWQRISKL